MKHNLAYDDIITSIYIIYSEIILQYSVCVYIYIYIIVYILYMLWSVMSFSNCQGSPLTKGATRRVGPRVLPSLNGGAHRVDRSKDHGGKHQLKWPQAVGSGRVISIHKNISLQVVGRPTKCIGLYQVGACKLELRLLWSSVPDSSVE